ncbi:MAG: PLP-dependent aminotransferase family protein [Erysipelotrichaceae bacterium]|nr:PLP-dependent aminotransferase family protein [Erysipelotrichaceae bacterium]MDY5252590.1 PLP-dependent aminotransferase family protein [Erysipelotrichaceae bacterium]
MNKYMQIAQDIEHKIIQGKLKPSSRLPSIIATSKKYHCAKGTVIKAYDSLLKKHLIYTKAQSGYYVANNLLLSKVDDTNIFDLRTGNPIVNNLSLENIKHCLNIASELYAKKSADIAISSVSDLHHCVCNFLATQSIYTKPANISMIQGITQILTILSLMPFPNQKKKILIEEPSFWNYINFLKQSNIDVLTIKRDINGIDLKQLEYLFKTQDIKFFYCITRNHNPLGTSLSYHQRKKIMELALKYDVYIIEDDYFSESFKIPKYVPIHFFSYGKNCIYLQSSSKNFPFIRIGLAIIPDDLINTFNDMAEHLYYYSYHIPSLVSQAVFEAYIKSNIFENENKIISNRLKEKLRLAQQICQNWDPTIASLVGGKCGYYAMIKVNPKITIKKLVENLQAQGILVKNNINAYYNIENFDNSIRISFANVQKNDLIKILDKIYLTICKQSKGENT